MPRRRGVAERASRTIQDGVSFPRAYMLRGPRDQRGTSMIRGFAAGFPAKRPRPPRLAGGVIEERLRRDDVSGTTERAGYARERAIVAALPRRLLVRSNLSLLSRLRIRRRCRSVNGG